MRITRLFSIATLLLAVQFPSSATTNAPFEVTFTQKFSSIMIENLVGRIEVHTWTSNRVKVVASRPAGSQITSGVETQTRFQITPTDSLRISVRETANPAPVNLSVFVPRQTNLVVRGGQDSVVINGATSALSVETEQGAISLFLPATTNTDLSLRTIEGTITSRLQMTIFGPVSAHSLDGRIGTGGSPIILRSARGALEILPDDPNRLARLDSETVVDRNAASDPVIQNSRFVTSGNNSEQNADATGPAEASTVGVKHDTAGLDVVKIDSRMVNLNVRVTDATGKLLPDLRKEDFEIFENNIRQEVVQFEPVTSPVNVVLLLDLSGSTHERWKTIKKAAKKFIETLTPTTPIAVAAFTRKFLLVSDFTLDRKLLRDRIDDTKNLRSGTAFYDATWSTLDLFKEVKERRKAIVVMTDGVDNSLSSNDYEARHPFDELLTRITQEEVTIYPIYFNTEFEVTVKMGGSDTHESYVTARKQLQMIADETGGTLFKADRAEDLEGVYQRVASELQTLYSVSYNPIDKNYDGKWRTVGVAVKRQHASARTRRGFYAK